MTTSTTATTAPQQSGGRTRFYQVGSFAVGNRLLPEVRSLQSSRERNNTLTSGHRACQGCGEALGARYVLDAATAAAERAGGSLVTVNATGCLEVFSSPYPESAWRLPWLHSLFGNAPAVATGVAAGLRAKGRDDIRVVAQGGDGGTVDIGFGCLSGMFERGDDVLYICYDNEAYMNTGVQRSGATPPAARTATTQAVGDAPGNVFGQGKDVPRIAMAHEIPYVATATVADLHDLERKVTYAMGLHGPRYIHVLVPCPLGWGRSPLTPCASPDWPWSRGSSRSSRPSTARSPGSVPSAARCRWRTTWCSSAASRTCSAPPRMSRRSAVSRPSPTATFVATACWGIPTRYPS
ncbi:thiamine pyrophosphate-dependent enzyme [Actinomyces sp. Z16]|uniref:thiamine pyrophosphate-dependent enzyme n=1 Tax=Actinomyces sp. Z16 TaxID=2079536 RepID=UPI001F435811|nr:thiamine pyrophosphate-dependent enzyme [Actinomyces sp. Z16]